MSMEWRGVDDVRNNMDRYGQKVEFAVRQVATYFQAVFEAYAKQNASWTDRTGLARARLHAWIEDVSEGVVDLYLSHGMHYGIYLETKYSGKYAIIWPTIRAHLEEIRQMLQSIFS